jgi:UDP-N-acetylmuramyl pentapeptide phosphotransferase/UDP-N-acetylglucosamine-1-phosphate transferase
VNATTIVGAAAVACVISCTATAPLRRLALRWDLIDRPGEKKAHARPTPYLGGIAIMFGTAVSTMAVLGLADRRITAILMAAMVVGLVGLVDDMSPLSPVTRLILETVAASEVVLSGVHVTMFGGWLDGVVTVLWIVVMTNTFNLLDNMDGALAVVATVTASFLAGMAFVIAHPALGVFLIALACGTLGFLPHNWAPAKIFMGDSGSLFIGFVLTCSAVLLVAGQGPDAAIAGLLLSTFAGTVDTSVVFLSRWRAGRSVMTGGTDHLSHRLRRMGLHTRTVAVVLGLIAAIAGVLWLAMALRWIPSLITMLVTCGAAITLISLLHGPSIYVPVEHLKTSPRIRERRR